MFAPSSDTTSLTSQGGLLGRLWRDHALYVVLGVCLSIGLLLVLLDLYVNWMRWSDSRAIRRMFNITREDGLASLFSVILTLAVALVLWIIYALQRQNTSSSKASGWLLIALFFTYMGIDDGAMVHERIGTAFSHANDDLRLPSYGWQVVIAPLFILTGLFMFVFLWKEGRRRIRRDWLIIALACLAIAMFLDFIEGANDGYLYLESRLNWSIPTITHFSKSLEEFLEMAGMSFMFIVFLNYFGALTEVLEITIVDRTIFVRRP